MMTTTKRSLAVALTLGLLPFFNLHAQNPATPLAREELAQLRESAQALAREIESLQDDIVSELAGQKERTLYRQADAALGELARFLKDLKPGTNREQLVKAFDALDHRVHDFLKAIRALGPEQRALQRAADRVSAADEHLHYAMHGSGPPANRMPEVTERQGRALVNSARHLEATADYVLGAAQGRGIFLAKLHKFTETCQRFHKAVAARATRKTLQREYQAVNQAWEQVTSALRDLRPAEHVHLIRLAERVDVLHDRLFRLLGLEGDRSRLIIRT